MIWRQHISLTVNITLSISIFCLSILIGGGIFCRTAAAASSNKLLDCCIGTTVWADSAHADQYVVIVFV
jgi:hypothetical protein